MSAASPQLAAHYDQAGMVQPAVDAYRLAGSRAVAVSALEEAIALFRRGGLPTARRKCQQCAQRKNPKSDSQRSVHGLLSAGA